MKNYRVNVNGTTYVVEVEEISKGDVKAPAAAPKAEVKAEAPKASAGANSVVAPMAGTILDVKVSNGQSVKKGQVLVVLEAMKMENEIMADRDGKVTSISVNKNSSVQSGDVLLTIE